MTLDGDELNLKDLKEEIIDFLGEGIQPGDINISCVLDGNKFDLAEDCHLMQMWAQLIPARDRKFHNNSN
ncbi:hypothetical protein FRX31_018056 [Thalictrum thalictroides]|uniref:Uncharacterized protein n=1 Tax=Thalictrum thalictroides TaxID=46969 RepID=A0A7J6W611_THATH|nr:hypothetical protein FRX31_018056 [Thalictrum thalictroides]